MDLFFRDKFLNISKNWNDLIQDIKNEKLFDSYCYTSDYYEVLKKVVLSILLGENLFC